MGGAIPGPTHPSGPAQAWLSDQPTPGVTCGGGTQGWSLTDGCPNPCLLSQSPGMDQLLYLSELQFLHL